MRIVRRHIGWVVLGLALLGSGCSSQDDRPGFFEAQLTGDFNAQVEGTARFALREEDETRFELIFFSEAVEILAENEMGPPREQGFVVRPQFDANERPTLLVEVRLGPNQSADIFEGESGELQIDRATDDVVEGRFNFEARSVSTGQPVFVEGSFSALPED